MKAMRRFLSKRQNRIALLMLGVFVVTAVAAPALAPPDDPANPGPFKAAGRRTDLVPHPPGPGLPFGTGSGQIDIFYSVVWGARTALRFGLIVALTTAGFGVLIGLLSGYLGGRVGGFINRFTDAFLAFPAAAGVALFSQLMLPPGPGDPPTGFQLTLLELGLTPVMLALIAFSWMQYARIVGAGVAQVKQADFVLAARAVGARSSRIMLRHLLPNVVSPAVVMVARDIGGMVILESAFTFIGLGGTVEWGLLLVRNRDWIVGSFGNPFTWWWVYLPATVALVLFGIGWNLLGDGLNDALNPRSER
jgi:peptide/nickel transport system permease protein